MGKRMNEERRFLPLTLVSDKRRNYVAQAAGRGFPVLLHICVAPLARRCGPLAAAKQRQ